MTQPGQPDQRGGGVAGNPETISGFNIERLGGMMTASPNGSFGQPNLLKNIVLDRLGGYALAPSARQIYSGTAILDVEEFEGRESIFIKSATSAVAVNPITGGVILSVSDSNQNFCSYKRGVAVTWTYNVDTINVYNSSQVGSVRNIAAPLAGVTVTAVNFTPAYPGTAGAFPKMYSAGSRHGFSGQDYHYIMLVPASYLGAEGTTLNPRLAVPNTIRPIIFKVAATGISTPEYFMRVYNPTGIPLIPFGAARPSLRKFDEYYDTPVGGATLDRSDTRSAIPAGKIIVAYVDVVGQPGQAQQFFQALNTGLVSKDIPTKWPYGYGSVIQDGQVAWVNVGDRTINTLSLSGYFSNVGNPPIDLLPPEVEYVAKSDSLGTWLPLFATDSTGTFDVYRSAAETPRQPVDTSPFFPLGTLAESFAARTWVAADATYRVYAYDVGTPNTDITYSRWEQAQKRSTLYYSEPDQPWNFKERFQIPTFSRSKQIIAMRSVGDFLVVLGESDAVVISGNSEANFSAQAIDIPGCYQRHGTCVLNGTLYYAGVGGIYRLVNGRAESIGGPIQNLLTEAALRVMTLTVDRSTQRIYAYIDNYGALIYDESPTLGEGSRWTTSDVPGAAFYFAGDKALVAPSPGGVLYAMDGPPAAQGTIEFLGQDGGDYYHNKRMMSVGMTFTTEGPNASVIVQTAASRVKTGSSGMRSEGQRTLAQGQAYAQWRTPDRVGFSFDLRIIMNKPDSGNVILRPNISIEAYKQGVIRNGYT